MKFYVKSSERKEDPAPLNTNPLVAIRVGIAIWLGILVVLLAAPAAIPAARPWWPYTCVVGIILGVLALLRYRKR